MADLSTGFNSGSARGNLNSFKNGMVSAITKYNSACEELMATLSSSWSSPIAVQFSSAYVPKMRDISSSLRTLGETVLSRASRAVSSFARANGSYFSFDSSISVGTCNPDILKEDLNGVVGMDINKVEEAIYSFESKMTGFFSSLDSLPTGIALYDPDGAQRSAYVSLIGGKKSEIKDLVSNMKIALKKSIEQEEDKIKTAKNRAVDTLS